MTAEDENRAKTIVDSWYWQMGEGHNFRWKNAVKSMTLFYESAPMSSDIAQLVLEYLRTREGVTSFIVGHKKWTFDAPGWNTKDAWYQTAPGEQWAGTQSAKVRVYWVLAQAGDGAADGPYTVEKGCKYKISHEYYWDVAAAPQLPQSTSGVQYAIQGFTRDRETGLFTYIVEKRETVEQEIALYESSKTIFETVSEKQHLGVKQSAVAGKGLAASVGNGVRVERHVEKNPDCTSNIVNRKTEATKVEETRKVVRKGLRGTTSATTDRNLTVAEVASKTAAEQEIGETRTVEKTDLDLRDLTVEKFTPTATPMTIAKSCERESGVHTDTTVEVVSASAANGSVEQTVEANKRKTVSIRKNDDGKTADKTTVTQTWTEKSGGGSSNYGNGIVVTTTERKENTTTTPAPESGVNKVVEIEETPNDHGSKTTVKRVTTYHEKTGGGTSDSGGGTVTTTTERKENTTTTPAPESGVNKVVEIEETPNDHGSKTTVKRVTQYRPERKSATGGTTTRTVTVESGVNQTEVPQDSPSVNKEVEISVSHNDHGSMTTQKRVTEHRPDSKTVRGGTEMRTVTVESGINQTNVPQDEPTVNKEVEISVSHNDHGSMSTQKRVTVHKPKIKQKSWSDKRYNYTYCAYANYPEPMMPSSGEIRSTSFHPNGHGSFDGSWLTRTPIKEDLSTVVLQWSIGPESISTKYYYFNKRGRLCSRTVSGQVYRCGGKLPHVAKEIQDRQASGFTGFPSCGWSSGVSGSYEHAMGVAYKVTSIGSEVGEDS